MIAISSSNTTKETVSEPAVTSVSSELLTETETTVTTVPVTSAEETETTTYTEGDDGYEQTGVSEYTSWSTPYSGQTTAETSAGESSEGEIVTEAESADEGISETGIETESAESVSESVEMEIAISNTESTSESVSVSDMPVISLNYQQAQAFSLIAAAFGVLVAAAVMVGKAKKRRKQKDDLSALTAKERDEIRLREKAKKKPKDKKKRKKRKAPKTVQQTMPYRKVCDESIIMLDEGRYSKTYRFEDINYSIAKQDEQESIFLGYCSVLNSFDTSADIQVTVHNNRVNKADFERMVLLKHTGDGYDKYRDEYNDMLREKMEQGQNGIIRNKYITVTVQAADLESAKSKFGTIDLELLNMFKKIGSNIKPLSSNERIRILKDIFRGVDEEIPELDQKQFKRGADKGYCCPDYMEFKKDYFMWGDKYARTMFIKDMPASLKDSMLTDIANTNLDVMVTVNITPVDPYKALKIVNHQLTSMRANKLQAEKKAIQSGYTSDVINEDLKHSLAEAEELLDDLRSKNQKMFLDNIIIMVTAKDMEELESATEAIEAVVRKHICSVATLKYQQEKGLQSVLPLGNCTLKIRRTLTTESTAVIMPFSGKEINHKNGKYYGLNALSNNMILFDRLQLKNPNGFILGSPGSGKSFSAKREMLNVFLATDDDIIIIDPEREYTNLVAALNGETIFVSPASNNFINPLDMSKDYSDDESPLVMKSDFILSFCECLVGKQGLNAKEKAIIDRCLTMTYGDYLIKFDPEKIPTLMDFYEVLKAQPEKEAKGLALSFELYIKGNLNVFAHKTNVDVRNRVVSYDIKDLGKQLKTLGMLIVLDYVWNRITVNRAQGKRTWIYMDEIYCATRSVLKRYGTDCKSLAA